MEEENMGEGVGIGRTVLASLVIPNYTPKYTHTGTHNRQQMPIYVQSLRTMED